MLLVMYSKYVLYVCGDGYIEVMRMRSMKSMLQQDGTALSAQGTVRKRSFERKVHR
jgi:hypothetical protein